MAGSEEEEERLGFYSSQSKEYTLVRKTAFLSNHLGIKLIHPEREREIYREEGRRERDWENLCLQSCYLSPVASRDLGLHNAM